MAEATFLGLSGGHCRKMEPRTCCFCASVAIRRAATCMVGRRPGRTPAVQRPRTGSVGRVRGFVTPLKEGSFSPENSFELTETCRVRSRGCLTFLRRSTIHGLIRCSTGTCRETGKRSGAFRRPNLSRWRLSLPLSERKEPVARCSWSPAS
jgi:hypothetical protein